MSRPRCAQGMRGAGGRAYFFRRAAVLVLGVIACSSEPATVIDAPVSPPDAPIDASAPPCVDDGGTADAGSPQCGVSSQSIARLCTLFASCNGGLGAVGDCAVMIMNELEGNHVGTFPHGEYSMVLDCASAASCSDFLDCFTRHHSIPYCTAHPGGSCDGEIAVQCPAPGDPGVTGAAQYVVDCGAIGLHCVTDGGNVGCHNGVSCTEQSAMCASCELPVVCDGSVANQPAQFMARFACPAGTVCRTWVDPASVIVYNAGCFADGPQCDPSSLPRCEGNTAVFCSGDRFPPSGSTSSVFFETRRDCGCSGHQCQFGRCVDTGTDCIEISTPDRCDGTTLVSCVNGSFVRIDCLSLGKAFCIANNPYSGCADSLPDGGT